MTRPAASSLNNPAITSHPNSNAGNSNEAVDSNSQTTQAARSIATQFPQSAGGQPSRTHSSFLHTVLMRVMSCFRGVPPSAALQEPVLTPLQTVHTTDTGVVDQGLGIVVEHVATQLPKKLDEIKNLGFASSEMANLLRPGVRHATIDLNLYQSTGTEEAPHASRAQASGLQKLPEQLLKYPNLESIKLNGPVTDETLALLAAMPSLRKLDLSSCQSITDLGLGHLAGLTQLKELGLYWSSQITDQGLTHLTTLSQLKHLKLYGCQQVTDQGVLHLTQLSQLERLDLYGSQQITDQGVLHLTQLSRLEHLNLYGSPQITDQGLVVLVKLSQLRRLDLGGLITITDQGLGLLARLTNLQYLNLSFCNRITDEGLAHLAGLTNLQHLNLSFGELITDEGLDHLAGLKQLQTLDLRCNDQLTEEAISRLATTLSNTNILRPFR